MKTGFIDSAVLTYITETPYIEPLGGSESSICYLSQHLAKLGNDVVLFSRIEKPVISLGVNCMPVSNISNNILGSFDALVIQNVPVSGWSLKPHLNPNTKLIFWTQNADDQEVVKSLNRKEIMDVYDYFIFVSNWQKNKYEKKFNIPKNKSVVFKNAASPVFSNLFSGKADVLKFKSQYPILAYTSTPYRGLDVLIKIFPEIKKAFPSVKLKVFSSMDVYQTPKDVEFAKYGNLYQLCRETKGVELIGSVSQTRLAGELKKVLVLAYPNTFAETSCISAIEAMAAGCKVITSDLGALKETTSGFANLINPNQNTNKYCSDFINSVVACLKNLSLNKNETNKLLNKQIVFMNKHYNWNDRSIEWNNWLTKITQ